MEGVKKVENCEKERLFAVGHESNYCILIDTHSGTGTVSPPALVVNAGRISFAE